MITSNLEILKFKYRNRAFWRRGYYEHGADIELHRAAQATFKRLLDGGKLPKMDALKTEGRELADKKKAAYGEYRAARKDMQEVVTAKANIDHLLSLTVGRKTRNRSGSDGDATQAHSADFGPSWPEVAGFGEDTPQQAVFEFWPQGKISKPCKCQYTCPACRLAESLNMGK